MFDVGDVERDMAELVRHDALGLEFLVREVGALEYLHHRALRIGEGQHIRDRRLRILLAFGLDAVTLHLLFESIEIVSVAELESRRGAHRACDALAQHHRMMIDRVGEKGRVLFLGRQRHAENVGVILGLLLEVGHFIAGVGDFLDADHADSPVELFPSPLWGGVRGGGGEAE